MHEWLAWLTLLLLAQWFFGNLYEAVVLDSNLLSLIELKGLAGEPLFQSKARSPVLYYLPPGLLGVCLTLMFAIASCVRHAEGAGYIVSTCVLLLAGLALTAYLVVRINLDLFFRPQADRARARRMFAVWTRLNYCRLALAGASLVTAILWMRTVLRP